MTRLRRGQLLTGGDPPPKEHDLPAIPTTPVARAGITEDFQLENAVARCGTCGRLFVSRVDEQGWGRRVRWVRLRWWHRSARRRLRAVKL